MEFLTMLMIGGGLFIVLAFFFRQHLSALIYDYGVDALFSFLDNFIGLGIIGLDVGDWIAAVIMFRKERNIVGVGFAILVAWEVTNFIPFSFIPGVGEGLETITGLLVPSAFLARIANSYFSKANKAVLKFESDLDLAKRIDIDVDEDRKLLEKVKKLIKKDNPIEALKEAKKGDFQIGDKLLRYLDSILAEVQQMVDGVIKAKPSGPDEMIKMLQAGILEGEQLMQEAHTARDSNDYSGAINTAIKAKQVIQSAFNNCRVYMEKEMSTPDDDFNQRRAQQLKRE